MSGRSAPATRLRKTFSYPDSDSDSDALPPAIDDQEQESLIATLAAQNTARNALFRRLLLPLPLLATIPYLIHFFPPSSRSLLAISSLCATSFLVHALPPESTGIPVLDALVQPARVTSQNVLRQRRAAAAPFATSSPLLTYLPLLNVALCALVAIAGYVAGSKPGAESASIIGLDALPALVYGAVILAKLIMGSVDPEGELEALKYDYKGA